VRNVEIAARGGVVTVSGRVRTSIKAHRMVEIARGVPGVVSVESRLVADDDLRVEVASAIRRAVPGSADRLNVRVELGEVRIGRALPSPGVQDAAWRAAASVPGVARVVAG
jgi:osmotically-inducible protein OsmY